MLKRYLRRHHITLQHNKIIGVNFSASNLSGAWLLFAYIEAESCQAYLYKDTKQDDKTELEEEEIKAERDSKQLADSPPEILTYAWLGTVGSFVRQQR
ncbi:MAG: hypothetical protein N3E45_08560 [Oscillatoriaceae bacterium SKW80]|nr:hypothetical protein [Oscillatoriaceae bacterium SKYG93]MCX8120871.1 hypothetical protein [Oscillatoriaceae bacterium SKW80]MDW8454212.1 hypothetical protein [Oscillatoriaceae cyanobacterium SKYGB_i_bin93]HIK26462.1 hypothetical protein [Oscillatoriaceae cyanobacterium M7585_C2015_266]